MRGPASSDGASEVLAVLQAGLDRLAAEAAANPPTSQRRRRLDEALRALSGRIERLLRDLDPIKHPAAIFDPSNPKIIGRFIALALVAQERHSLAAVAQFYGFSPRGAGKMSFASMSSAA